jgi:glutathione S-transferase
VSGVSVRRLLSAPRERVFQAWTRPELIARWFFPGEGWTTAVTCDLRVGGRYELAMRDAEGGRHVQFGHYREIVPVSRLVFTWTCPELAVTDSVVTVELVDRGARTELILTHELPPDPDVRRGHEEGWHGCLGNLERLLAEPGGKDER